MVFFSHHLLNVHASRLEESYQRSTLRLIEQFKSGTHRRVLLRIVYYLDKQSC